MRLGHILAGIRRSCEHAEKATRGCRSASLLAVGCGSLVLVGLSVVPSAAAAIPGEGVTKEITAISVTASSDQTTYGQAVEFTATVSGGPGSVPGGTVTLFDGGTALNSVQLSAGTAEDSWAWLPPGADSVTAVYNGAVGYLGSTSSRVVVDVSPATPAVTLTASKNPSRSGQPVTYTATVSGVPSGAVPTGSVIFSVDGFGSITFGEGAGNSLVSLSGGTARWTTSVLTVGEHDVSASYSGDAYYQAAVSSPDVEQQVGYDVTVTLASSDNPSESGKPVRFTAVVQPVGTSQMPVGIVIFTARTEFSADTVLAKVKLVPVGPVDEVTYVTSALTAGIHIIQAAYTGDGTFGKGKSHPLLVQTVYSCPAGASQKTCSRGP